MCTNKYPNPPHKHAELIKAWADGCTMQCLQECGGHSYGTCPTPFWEDVDSPTWDLKYKYRIKPITKKYRVVLHVDGPHVARNDVQRDNLEKSKHFIRWLTDWIEYEV